MSDWWRILKENQFEIKQEITDDLKCIICRNILINAHSGPCGCLYCLDCIKEHLMKSVDNESLCPGNSNECKNKTLSVGKDVLLDRSTNNKISKVRVKCSMNGCEFNDELRNIEDHLRVCSMQYIKCPYFNIGCKQSYLLIDNINNHIIEEILLHSNLLLESVDNLKNEIESLNKYVTELKLENKSLKDEFEIMKTENNKNKIMIENLEANDKMNKTEIDELKQKMISLKNENRLLTDEIKQMKNNDDEQRQKSALNTEMKTKIFDDNVHQNNLRNEMNTKIDKISEENNIWTKKTNEIVKKLELDTFNLQIKMINIDSNMEKQIYGDFLWIIHDWDGKVQDAKTGLITSIFSDIFYTHKYGYKICLRAYPLGIGDGKLTHFSLFFHVMRGEFDNALPWPCKIDVTFDLFNQVTGLISNTYTTKHETKPICSAYKKPINEKNTGLGIPKFIGLDELLNNSALLKDNKLMLKCSVKLIS